jgi:pyruvate dehydrogenase E1 component
MRERLGLTSATERDRLDPMTPTGQWAAARREHLARHRVPVTPPRCRCPTQPGCAPDRAPVVTVHDAASHTVSWLGSALGVPAVSLGVDGSGQSGAVADLRRAHDLDSGSIVNAALAALSLK